MFISPSWFLLCWPFPFVRIGLLRWLESRCKGPNNDWIPWKKTLNTLLGWASKLSNTKKIPGWWFQPIWKNIGAGQIGRTSSPIFEVNIPKISELPPPRSGVSVWPSKQPPLFRNAESFRVGIPAKTWLLYMFFCWEILQNLIILGYRKSWLV